VWDVGANVGLFTFAAAGLAGPGGHVVSVEADVWLANNLLRYARRNHYAAPVSVVPAAAGARAGIELLEVSVTYRATSHLASAAGGPLTGGVRYRQVAPTVSLDSLLEVFPPPDVLKIDVEGAEVKVLEGAIEVLRKCPVMLIEIASQNSAACHEQLRAFDVRVWHGPNYLALPRRPQKLE
jgi:FkbM family methyltransferase